MAEQADAESEVEQAFYRLTVAQRDGAWGELERVARERDEARAAQDRAEGLLRQISEIVDESGMGRWDEQMERIRLLIG